MSLLFYKTFEFNASLHCVTFFKVLLYSKLQASSDEENNSLGSDDEFPENEEDDEELPTQESDEVCHYQVLFKFYLRC